MAVARATGQPSLPKLMVSREEAAEQIKYQIDRGYEIKGLPINSELEWERAREEESRWSGYNIGLLERLFDSSLMADEYIRLHTGFISQDAPLSQREQEFRMGVDCAIARLEYIVTQLDSIHVRASFAYKIFLACVISFIVLFLIGLVQGYSIRKKPDYLIPIINNNIDLKKEQNGHIYIAYTCHESPYKYYIDDNIVQRLTDTTIANLPESPSVLALLLGDDTIIKVLLGGLTVYSFKETLNFIIGKESERKPSNIVGLIATQILSAASGYALGYWAAIAYPPRCNSPRILALLDNPLEWKRFERQVWQVSRKKIEHDLGLFKLKNIQDQLLIQAISKIERIKNHTADTQHDFKTSDFKALEEVARLRDILWGKYM
jgi:hypothetical protein